MAWPLAPNKLKYMEIILNNRPEEFNSDQLTIDEILQLKNYSFKMLIIKINGHIVKKDQYSTAVVKNGDDVMILHLISGG
jgi:sulfur carrier protein